MNTLMPSLSVLKPKVLEVKQQSEVDSVKTKTTEVQLGNTHFIIEYEASQTATETAYDKVKGLILSHSKDAEKLSIKTRISA